MGKVGVDVLLSPFRIGVFLALRVGVDWVVERARERSAWWYSICASRLKEIDVGLGDGEHSLYSSSSSTLSSPSSSPSHSTHLSTSEFLTGGASILTNVPGCGSKTRREMRTPEETEPRSRPRALCLESGFPNGKSRS